MLGRTDHDVQVPLPRLPAIDRRRIRAGSTGANLSVSLDEGAAALPFHTERSRRQTQTGLLRHPAQELDPRRKQGAGPRVAAIQLANPPRPSASSHSAESEIGDMGKLDRLKNY